MDGATNPRLKGKATCAVFDRSELSNTSIDSHVVEEEGIIEGTVSSALSHRETRLTNVAQVIILGDSGVGKTSLMNQYVCPPFYLSVIV